MKDIPLDLSKVEKELLELMPKVGEVILKYWLKKNIPTRKKSTIDIVTIADLESDRFIAKSLQSKYPLIPILSEETAPPDYTSLLLSDLLWIIDPLDGTANFSRGDSNFCVSVALASQKKPIIGVIYKPVERKLYWAREDRSGAFLDGNKIRISQVKKMSDAVVCTDWSHNLQTKKESVKFLDKVAGRVKQIKILGSAAANLALVAEGKVDLYQEVYLDSWDSAAGALIIEKAGGLVTDNVGKAWNISKPAIMAGNPFIHAQISNLLKESV